MAPVEADTGGDKEYVRYVRIAVWARIPAYLIGR